MKDAKGFSGKLNNLLGSPPLIEVRADVHNANNTSGAPQVPSTNNTSRVSQVPNDATYDWDISGDDVPLLETAIDHSTPARHNTSRKRPSDQTQIPVLFKKKAPTPNDGEAQILEEVKSAYLGSARILTSNLSVGPQIRQLNDAFVSELVGKMKEFPGHFYQPLCAIMESPRDCLSFRESNANGFHYKVIGGCHNLTAAKRLEEALPAVDVFKSRLCCVYNPSLSEEAVMWLANQHNKVGEFHHTMGLKEKIQLCRNLRQTCGHGGQTEKWKDAVQIILGSDHSKGVLKLFTKIACLDQTTFGKVEEVLTLHSEGRLKQQRLRPEDIVKGPVMKPYALANIPSLPPLAVQHLLQSVIDNELTFADFQKETKILCKLQIVQRMFLDLMDFKTWEEARTAYPEETERETLEHFIKFPLRSVPPELKTFCKGLKQRDASAGGADFKGVMGAVGIVVNCNALILEENAISEKIGEFPGASLMIIDKPKNWTSGDVRSCLAALTGINLGKAFQEFTAVILSSIDEIPGIVKAIEETRHFDAPMKAFYCIHNHSKSHRLTECIFGMTMATRNRSKNIIWSSGNSQNLIEVQSGSIYYFDGIQVDEEQKPIQLYSELMKALTTPGEFVLDVCCGTGTGIIAGMQLGRNVIGVEVDEEVVRHIHLRVSEEVGGAESEVTQVNVEGHVRDEGDEDEGDEDERDEDEGDEDKGDEEEEDEDEGDEEEEDEDEGDEDEGDKKLENIGVGIDN